MVKGSPNPLKGTCPWLLIDTQRDAEDYKRTQGSLCKKVEV